MGATERQNELLLAISAADDAADDTFFTGSSSDGTSLFHTGFPENGQIEIAGMGSVEGLAQRGCIRITGRRQHGDVDFAITPFGKQEAERLRLGGKTPAEAEAERADRAEQALASLKDDIAAAAEREIAHRKVKAARAAQAVALLVTLGLGAVIYLAATSDNKIIAVLVGVVAAAGLTGWVAAAPFRTFVARRIERLLLAVHDRT